MDLWTAYFICWNHAIRGLLGVTSLTWHNMLKAHLHRTTYKDPLPFYGWLVFHCVIMPQFVYSFFYCQTFVLFLYFLAVVSNAVVDVHVHEHVFFSVVGTDLGVVLLANVVVLCLTFGGTATPFSRQPFYTLPCPGSPFSKACQFLLFPPSSLFSSHSFLVSSSFASPLASCSTFSPPFPLLFLWQSDRERQRQTDT